LHPLKVPLRLSFLLKPYTPSCQKLSNRDDNDTVVDGQDAFPLDSTEPKDTDDDGIGDNAAPDPPGAKTHQLFLPVIRG
jgi:hypothetical protein